MKVKDFLLNECENVRNTLREVLRHEYAAGSSEIFYRELTERLQSLRRLLEPADPKDSSFLGVISSELSILSTLVHQIERSQVGEFSWPFAECLQRLAIPLCKEQVPSQDSEPIIRVYAEGGLDSYKINLESDLSVLNVGRRIFTIVFPRTLRHQVLLHTIFGHEIGHAAWTIPGHRAYLRDQVLRPLQKAGPLTSTSSATNWLRNDLSAPAPVIQLRKQYPDPYYTDIDLDQWESWYQEFMCDLFGLVTFGPSFLAAHQTLLLALDPSAFRWGPEHPPYACRKAMLWRAHKSLGWQDFGKNIKDKKVKQHFKQFTNDFVGSAPGAWEDVFPQAQVDAAVRALSKMLSAAQCPPYAVPDGKALSALIEMLSNRIPPCGADLHGNKTPRNIRVDFRHILFAGWLLSGNVEASINGDPKLSFLQMNKLCEMGILHQRAIDLYEMRKRPV